MVTKIITAIDGAVITSSSTWIPVKDAKKITMFCTRADHSSGNTVFSVAVSPDETTSVTYNKLIDNLANTNGEQLTRVASKTLSANGTAMLSVSPEDAFGFIKITGTRTTDGSATVILVIQYD